MGKNTQKLKDKATIYRSNLRVMYIRGQSEL